MQQILKRVLRMFKCFFEGKEKISKIQLVFKNPELVRNVVAFKAILFLTIPPKKRALSCAVNGWVLDKRQIYVDVLVPKYRMQPVGSLDHTFHHPYKKVSSFSYMYRVHPKGIIGGIAATFKAGRC